MQNLPFCPPSCPGCKHNHCADAVNFVYDTNKKNSRLPVSLRMCLWASKPQRALSDTHAYTLYQLQQRNLHSIRETARAIVGSIKIPLSAMLRPRVSLKFFDEFSHIYINEPAIDYWRMLV